MPRRPAPRAPATPAPPYTLAEVAAAAGVAPRTVRFWAKQNLLGSAEFRGPATRYTRSYLLQTCAVAALREQGSSYRQIGQRIYKAYKDNRLEDFEALGAAKAAAFDAARSGPPTPGAPPNAATNMPANMPANLPANLPADASPPPPFTAPPEPAYPAERWERVVLMPGLELHVNPSGGPLLRRVAQQIYACFGLGAAKVETSS